MHFLRRFHILELLKLWCIHSLPAATLPVTNLYGTISIGAVDSGVKATVGQNEISGISVAARPFGPEPRRRQRVSRFLGYTLKEDDARA